MNEESEEILEMLNNAVDTLDTLAADFNDSDKEFEPHQIDIITEIHSLTSKVV